MHLKASSNFWSKKRFFLGGGRGSLRGVRLQGDSDTRSCESAVQPERAFRRTPSKHALDRQGSRERAVRGGEECWVVSMSVNQKKL